MSCGTCTWRIIHSGVPYVWEQISENCDSGKSCQTPTFIPTRELYQANIIYTVKCECLTNPFTCSQLNNACFTSYKYISGSGFIELSTNCNDVDPPCDGCYKNMTGINVVSMEYNPQEVDLEELSFYIPCCCPLDPALASQNDFPCCNE